MRVRWMMERDGLVLFLLHRGRIVGIPTGTLSPVQLDALVAAIDPRRQRELARSGASAGVVGGEIS